MRTYWLNGADHFDKQLPSAEMRASEKDHEFK